MVLRVTIPGEPVAQGRPRAFRRGAHINLVDPTRSRSWKAFAAGRYEEALCRYNQETGLRAYWPLYGEGPLEVHLLAVFTCPASQHRKREPVPRRPRIGRPDADNLLKAALDAGNGILWGDDSQVARATVEKVTGAQGEAPRVEITVRPLTLDSCNPADGPTEDGR